MKKKFSHDLPIALQVDKEQNTYIRQFKSSLQKRFKLTRMNELFEAVDTAYFLISLGRLNEARNIVEFLVNSVKFTGNYNIWTPIGCAIILKARLERLEGDAKARSKSLETLIKYPYRVPVQESEIAVTLAEGKETLGEIEEERSQKWACHKLSRLLMELCYFRETGEKGFDHSGKYHVEDFENLIVKTLEKLKKRLEQSPKLTEVGIYG